MTHKNKRPTGKYYITIRVSFARVSLSDQLSHLLNRLVSMPPRSLLITRTAAKIKLPTERRNSKTIPKAVVTRAKSDSTG